MKSTAQPCPSPHQVDDDVQELEILKAVAQAWHAHSGTSTLTHEHDARRLNFKRCPSRFKLEAMNRASLKLGADSKKWDFNQSLLDSYEIVSVSKKLETALVVDIPFDTGSRIHRRKRESTNSLRSLFNMVSASSKRFNDKPDVKYTQF